MVDALHSRGDVEIVGIAARHLRPAPIDVRPSIPIHSVQLPRRVLYDAWHYLRRPAVARYTGPIDIVHATGGVVPPPGPAALAVTVHDLAFLHRPDYFTKRGVRFLTKAFDLARRTADIVIIPSQATASDCANRGVDPDRLRIVPWGVTALNVAPEEVDFIYGRHDLPETFVLWVGTAEPRKNLRGLLAAMERMSIDVPLVLVGPDGWGTDVGALVEATNHPVIRLGHVPDRELAALYRAARLFVYPSLLEGFGMPVLEAMIHGTPVVTSSGTATEEVCGDSESVVDPEDLDALAAAIELVVLDDSVHTIRSTRARERAQEFTWEATADGVMAAYEDARR